MRLEPTPSLTDVDVAALRARRYRLRILTPAEDHPDSWTRAVDHLLAQPLAALHRPPEDPGSPLSHLTAAVVYGMNDVRDTLAPHLEAAVHALHAQARARSPRDFSEVHTTHLLAWCGSDDAMNAVFDMLQTWSREVYRQRASWLCQAAASGRGWDQLVNRYPTLPASEEAAAAVIAAGDTTGRDVWAVPWIRETLTAALGGRVKRADLLCALTRAARSLPQPERDDVWRRLRAHPKLPVRVALAEVEVAHGHVDQTEALVALCASAVGDDARAALRRLDLGHRIPDGDDAVARGARMVPKGIRFHGLSGGSRPQLVHRDTFTYPDVPDDPLLVFSTTALTPGYPETKHAVWVVWITHTWIYDQRTTSLDEAIVRARRDETTFRTGFGHVVRPAIATPDAAT